MHLPRSIALPALGLGLAILALLTPSLFAEGNALGSVRPMAQSMPGYAVAKSAPAKCSSGVYTWAHLTYCGWAGPGSTGPRESACPSGRLKNVGTNDRHIIHVKRKGQTVKCENIVGCLSIEAPNVTVHDVAIRCTSGRTGESANGTSVILVEKGASASLSHLSIKGMRGVHACVWHNGTRLRVSQLNCQGVNDGIFSWSRASKTSGNHFTIKDSYFHDFTTRTANGHIDGYQTEGAAYGLIEHNTYLMTSDDKNATDSAIAIWNSMRNSHDIAVQRNLISGGGFSVYVEDYSPSESSPSGGYSVENVTVADNVFSNRLYGCVGRWGVWYTRGEPTDGWHRSGNTVLETKGHIDHRNPIHNGQLCT